LIIIPAYNESENILSVIENIKRNASQCDYIVINDCSHDDTEQICLNNNIPVISLPVNLGIGGAVQTGYKYAFYNNYDAAIQVDGDGQHDAKYIERMLNTLKKENCDMVIGSRYIDREGFQSSVIRRIGIRYFSWLIRLLTRQKITDPTSGFRACNRKVIEVFSEKYPFDFPEPEVIVQLAKQKSKTQEVSVKMYERQGGKSSITPIKSMYYMYKVTIGILFAATEKTK